MDEDSVMEDLRQGRLTMLYALSKLWEHPMCSKELQAGLLVHFLQDSMEMERRLCDGEWQWTATMLDTWRDRILKTFTGDGVRNG